MTDRAARPGRAARNLHELEQPPQIVGRRRAQACRTFWPCATKRSGRELHHEVLIRCDTETEAKALDQVARCLDRSGLGEGWLLLFDLRKEVSWADKLFVREVKHEGKQIHIVGC